MEISVETLIAQQLAYTFLGKVFYEPPTLELIQAIVSDDLFADWPFSGANAEEKAGLDQLRQFSVQWDNTQLDDLRRNHARLFVGPNRLLAPPWESVYRSSEHLLFERQTFEVRQQYQRFGMETRPSNVEPDDHIGLELRFMAHLNGLALFAMDKGDANLSIEAVEAIRLFLTEHLLQWSPEFLTLVTKSATTAYYRAIAQLTLGCLYHTNTALGIGQLVT
jgi:TorA maturation chaperone TorD